MLRQISFFAIINESVATDEKQKSDSQSFCHCPLSLKAIYESFLFQ